MHPTAIMATTIPKPMPSPTKSAVESTAQPTGGISPAVLFWVAVLLLVMGGTILVLASRARNSSVGGHVAVSDTEYLRQPDLEQGKLVTEFTLTERSGRKISSTELAGRPYLASFFYSNCPTECVQQNTKLGELAREFADQEFSFLSISCEPDIDHPARLREYADKFRPPSKAWLFLTGDLTYTRRIGAEMFQVPVDLRSHTERLIAIDRNGKLRGHFNWKDPAQMTALRKLMKVMLAEKVAPAADKPEAKEQTE